MSVGCGVWFGVVVGWAEGSSEAENVGAVAVGEGVRAGVAVGAGASVGDGAVDGATVGVGEASTSDTVQVEKCVVLHTK